MPSRTATAYPPTSGAGIARAAAGGYERLPEMANPITECDKAPEPRRARTADLVAYGVQTLRHLALPNRTICAEGIKRHS